MRRTFFSVGALPAGALPAVEGFFSAALGGMATVFWFFFLEWGEKIEVFVVGSRTSGRVVCKDEQLGG